MLYLGCVDCSHCLWNNNKKRSQWNHGKERKTKKQSLPARSAGECHASWFHVSGASLGVIHTIVVLTASLLLLL